MSTILIIDDNPAVLTALDVLFSMQHISVIGVTTPSEGLNVLRRADVDLVIQDMNFSRDTTSGDEGEELFHAIRQLHPDVPVILLTAWTQLSRAVALIKSGAADYLAKPWDDQRLLVTVNNLLELRETQRALQQRLNQEHQLHRQLQANNNLCGMIWRDGATERVLRLATQVARSTVPVLITGPNGAGKECIASIIQANSAVRDGPFVVVNCGAIPKELIEAELFGADAGAYTGATKAREGKFEAANGGTLFLDEIGNLPLAGQMKLLRVLETGRFQRIGSNREQSVRVRIISATNADLPAMIRAGHFREDLYYRINVIEVAVPALSERPQDIAPLAQHFLGEQKQLSEAAIQALMKYPWPGNVRELKNVMQRVAILCNHSIIEPGDLALPNAISVGDMSVLSDSDRDLIEAAIARHKGVLSQAAAELGLSRQSLYRRMDKLGISRSGSDS